VGARRLRLDPAEGHGFADRRLQRFTRNAFNAMLGQ